MSIRVHRVRGEIRKEISRMLMEGRLRDPRLAEMLISITDVELSRDLHYATVFITVMGGDDKDEALRGLGRASGFIRSELGRALRLRHVPQLSFKIDGSFEYSNHIEKLLHTIDIPDEDTDDATEGTESNKA